MKKSDLKDFMVVQLDVRNYERENEDMYLVIGNTLVSGEGYMNLSHYDENMENTHRDKFFDNSIGTYSIVKVFEIKDISKGIEFFFNEDNLKLIWGQREIDWSKVPKWTKAQYERNGDWINCYHINYDEQSKYWPCEYTVRDKFTFETEKYIQCVNEQNYRIHPSVTIPEEWYK